MSSPLNLIVDMANLYSGQRHTPVRLQYRFGLDLLNYLPLANFILLQ